MLQSDINKNLSFAKLGTACNQRFLSRRRAYLLLVILAVSLVACDDENPVGESTLSVSPSSLDFGAVQVDTQASLRVDVTNTSGDAVTLGASIGGTDAAAFAFDGQPLNILAAGATTAIDIVFRPVDARRYDATLTLGITETASVPLRGTGVATAALELTAARTAVAPVVDGDPGDAAWSAAAALQVQLSQVEPESGDDRMFPAQLRAVHDGTFLYILVRVTDLTQDELPNRWEYLGGDPSSEAQWRRGDDGQDGVSLIFAATANVADDDGMAFARVGCDAACHTSRQTALYEGGMYPGAGIIDLWYWKAGTTNPQGFADDFFAVGNDGQLFRNERRGDIGKSFEQPNFSPVGGGLQLPTRVAGDGNNGFDPAKFLWDDTDVGINFAVNPATGNAWQAGDVVPGWLLRVDTDLLASRSSVEAKGVFTSGEGWSVEFRRRLNTGKEDDAVFNAGSTLPFSLGYFDNARKYAAFEYEELASPPKPSHFGTLPRVINIEIQD